VIPNAATSASANLDPKRNAVLLVAGDKAGQWEAWYKQAGSGRDRPRQRQDSGAAAGRPLTRAPARPTL
jgi:hypothetical protein